LLIKAIQEQQQMAIEYAAMQQQIIATILNIASDSVKISRKSPPQSTRSRFSCRHCPIFDNLIRFKLPYTPSF